jgi:hypothetical protein
LDNGKIAGLGTYDVLLKDNSAFKTLFLGWFSDSFIQFPKELNKTMQNKVIRKPEEFWLPAGGRVLPSVGWLK